MAKKKVPVIPPMDFGTLINQTLVKPEDEKKKSTNPVIFLDEELSTKLTDFVTNKKTVKTSETAMRQAEEPILTFCKDRQDKDALSGNFVGTYEIRSKTGDTVKFITVDRFSMPQDEAGLQAVKEILGDKADEIIKKKVTISLKPEIFENEELQKELVGLIGNNFTKFFESKATYGLKSGFDEKIYQIANNDPEKVAQIRTIITQTKPSLR